MGFPGNGGHFQASRAVIPARNTHPTICCSPWASCGRKLSLVGPPREQLSVSLIPAPGIRWDVPILGGEELQGLAPPKMLPSRQQTDELPRNGQFSDGGRKCYVWSTSLILNCGAQANILPHPGPQLCNKHTLLCLCLCLHWSCMK